MKSKSYNPNVKLVSACRFNSGERKHQEHQGPWKGLDAVESVALAWVDWLNNRRLLEPIGNIPPVEAEDRFYADNQGLAMVARDSNQTASGKLGAGQAHSCSKIDTM